MKVVLDTNCILQIVFPQSYHKEVWDALVARKYTICVSNEILLEYREILERRTGSALFAEEVVEAILSMPNTERVAPSFHFHLITADPDDNKFVDCAIAAEAEYIVTNDKHFNPLKDIPWPKVEVIKIAEFVKQL